MQRKIIWNIKISLGASARKELQMNTRKSMTEEFDDYIQNTVAQLKELDRLRAVNAKLVAALERVLDENNGGANPVSNAARHQARAALAKAQP